jgi:hypothetical protein
MKFLWALPSVGAAQDLDTNLVYASEWAAEVNWRREADFMVIRGIIVV